MAANLAIIVAIREIDRRIAATMAFILLMLLILARGVVIHEPSLCAFRALKFDSNHFFFSKLIR